MRILPPTYFFLTLVLSIAVHFLLPISQIVDWPYRWAGVLIIIAGSVITIWADAVFKRVKTTVKPNQIPSYLVIAGPFRFSRHPMYLGMGAVLIGVAVLLGSVTAFLGPLSLCLVLHFVFIAHEERVMRDQFGKAYEVYASRVRQWL